MKKSTIALIFVVSFVVATIVSVVLESRPPDAPQRLLTQEEMAALPKHSLGIVIVKDGCSVCADAKQWLQQQGLQPVVVSFDEVAGNQLAKALGIEKFPTLIRNGNLIQGFSSETWGGAFGVSSIKSVNSQ